MYLSVIMSTRTLQVYTLKLQHVFTFIKKDNLCDLFTGQLDHVSTSTKLPTLVHVRVITDHIPFVNNFRRILQRLCNGMYVYNTVDHNNH